MNLLILEKPEDILLNNYKLMKNKEWFIISLTLGDIKIAEKFMKKEFEYLMQYIGRDFKEFGVFDFNYNNLSIDRIKHIINKYIKYYRPEEIILPYSFITKKIIEDDNINVLYYNSESERDEFITDVVIRKSELTLEEIDEKKDLSKIFFSLRHTLPKMLDNNYYNSEKYRSD